MLGAKQQTNMDDCGKSKSRGGRYCAAGAPNDKEVQEKPKTLWAKWVKFVGRHRPDFKDPTSKYASLREARYEDSCCEHNQFIDMSETTETQKIMWG